MAPRCQCDPSCTRPPLKGSPFCTVHMRGCTRKAPLSKSEYPFKPQKYNGRFEIQDSHNCFAYAFAHMDIPPKKDCTKVSCNIPFHQPGRKAGFPKWGHVKGKRCPDLIGRLLGDVPGLQLSSFTRKCPKGSYKVAAVIDPKNDYHFYRQDADGLWSHKPGATKVTRRDASKHLIYDPSLCDRTTASLDYNRFCSFMCVPRRKRTLRRA